MNETRTKPNLNQLIEEAHQGVVQQQEATAAIAGKRSTPSNVKNLLGYLLLAVFLVVVFLQYPRINAPYVWPDANASPIAAEADLEAVVALIETYRRSQGQYPASLGEIQLPDGLAKMVEVSKLDYSPRDQGYALAWTLPNWLATYNSATEKIGVEPGGKR